VASNMDLIATADLHSKSAYYVEVSLNPGSLQEGYTLVDASLRLASVDKRWEIALIGQNLTNVIYGTIGQDKPAGIGEVEALTGAPRTIKIEIAHKF